MAIKTESAIQTIELTTQRLQELNERALAESRKTGLVAVDAYEKIGLSFAELQARVARTSRVDVLTGILDAQAEVTRTLVGAQAGAVRSVLS